MERWPTRRAPGDGWLLLQLAEVVGWSVAVTARGAGAGVRVRLEHPVYGALEREGESVSAVALGLVETALIVSRLGVAVRVLSDLVPELAEASAGARADG